MKNRATIMKTLMALFLSLFLFCNISFAEQGGSSFSTVTSQDTLPPKAFMTDPDKLIELWSDTPIPLSAYSDEEIKLPKYINEKTADAVATYSTKEQEKDWTKYDNEEITPYIWKILELDLTESNGKTFATTLLRPNWWIRNIGADKKGNRFYLKIPEVAEG